MHDMASVSELIEINIVWSDGKRANVTLWRATSNLLVRPYSENHPHCMCADEHGVDACECMCMIFAVFRSVCV